MTRRIGALFAVVMTLLPGRADAGPWTKGPGQLYLEVSEGLFLAGDYVDARARQTADVEYLSFTTALYAEAGVLPGLELSLYLPHVAGLSSFSGGYNYLSLGAGDTHLGVQWAPGLLPFPHAIRAVVKLPLYALPVEPRFPARGDGQVDATIWLSAGRSLEVLPLYLFGELGHRFRTELYPSGGDGLSFGDGLVFAAQVGLELLPGSFLSASASGVLPYRSDETTKGLVTAGGAASLALGLGLSAKVSVEGTVWAQNSSRGISALAGISFSR